MVDAVVLMLNVVDAFVTGGFSGVREGGGVTFQFNSY
jgi:hypothetical protein